MQLGNVINIGLGLAFTFFLLSLIASGIQECLAGFFKWRGTYLAKALDVILSNDPNATFGWYGFNDWLRAHLTTLPGMTEAEVKAKSAAAAGFFRRPVARLPETNNAERALQIANAPLTKLVAVINSHPLMKNVPVNLPSYISGKTFAMVLLSALRDGSRNSLFAQIESTITSLPDGDLKATLNTFLQDAGGDLDKFRQNIENWFDSAMDRLSGIYKRISQYFLLSFGAILTIVFNVNALHLSFVLWHTDPATLSATADVAAQATTADAQGTWRDIGNTLSQLQSLNLPIGWAHPPNWEHVVSIAYWSSHIEHVFGKYLAGWFVTTAAVSLGAPFWFEFIQKLVPLRSTGPKPDSSTPSPK